MQSDSDEGGLLKVKPRKKKEIEELRLCKSVSVPYTYAQIISHMLKSEALGTSIPDNLRRQSMSVSKVRLGTYLPGKVVRWHAKLTP